MFWYVLLNRYLQRSFLDSLERRVLLGGRARPIVNTIKHYMQSLTCTLSSNMYHVGIQMHVLVLREIYLTRLETGQNKFIHISGVSKMDIYELLK